MKNIFFLVLSIFIFSCESDIKDSPKAQLPHYDESNSELIAWSDLPSELRDAKEIPYTKEKSTTFQYSAGPWGGVGGQAFDCKPPAGSKLYAIAIQAGVRIDRFTVWYKDKNGTIYVGLEQGGNGGKYYYQRFSEDEFITNVSGRAGVLIDKLSFQTNKKSFSYGGTGGNVFEIGTLPSNMQILGFYGGSGSMLDRIGFHVYSRD